jgi:glucokinase
MNEHSNEFLLADIGGTHARFALTVGGQAGPVEDLRVASYPQPADALRAFLAHHPGVEPLGAVLAGAGPVSHNRIAMTNSPWVIDGGELRQIFDLPWVQVINDFEALAWALPDLRPSGSTPSAEGKCWKERRRWCSGPERASASLVSCTARTAPRQSSRKAGMRASRETRRARMP